MIPPCCQAEEDLSFNTPCPQGTARLPVTWAKGSTKLNSGIAAADLKSKVWAWLPVSGRPFWERWDGKLKTWKIYKYLLVLYLPCLFNKSESTGLLTKSKGFYQILLSRIRDWQPTFNVFQPLRIPCIVMQRCQQSSVLKPLKCECVVCDSTIRSHTPQDSPDLGIGPWNVILLSQIVSNSIQMPVESGCLPLFQSEDYQMDQRPRVHYKFTRNRKDTSR